MIEFLIFFLFSADLQLQDGVRLSQNGMYERSEVVLKQIDPNRLSNPSQLRFYRFLNNFMMNKEKEANQFSFLLENEESLLPERYKVVAALMREDIRQWKTEDLGDISRDMSHIKDRLKNADGGQTTQKIQRDVVAKLDKMIKDAEDQLKKQQEQEDQANNQQTPSPQRPLQPAQDSQIINQGGTGEVNKAKLNNLSARWGSLPPREQTRALQELTQGMSPRHREAIENYFRNIANAQGKRGR